MDYIVKQTESFSAWRKSMKDLRAATAIRRRISRAESGNLGDVKPVGGGVSEMRVDVGAGYRMYFTLRDRIIVLLLVGATSPPSNPIFARRLKWQRRFESWH